MDYATSSALVTGGASGLGAATVRRLAATGAWVVIFDLPKSPGAALAASLGDRVRFVPGDVTDAASVQAAVHAADNLRLTVCCAGVAIAQRTITKDGSPHDLDLFRRVIEVNLVGTFNTVRLAAAKMVQNNPDNEGERGVIVTTASVASFDGQIGQAAYASSKGGISSLTLPLARDLSRHGIRVVSIAPGTFDTPLLAGLPEEARNALATQVPFPSRLGRPDEYAALVQHIVENRMLNGETIRLDGALRMAPK